MGEFRDIFKFGAGAILIIGGLSVVGAATGIITSPFRSAAGVVERTLNPDNVISNYEWFKQQYNDVLAFDEKIGVASFSLETFEKSAGPRTGWRFEERQEWNRLNSILVGLRNQQADMKAAYNAKSKMANRSIFKTNDLPETL